MSEELPLPQTPVESGPEADSGQDLFGDLVGVSEPENALPPDFSTALI